MKKYILQTVTFVAIVFIGVTFATHNFGPHADPTGDNVAEPINVGTFSQTKQGALTVNNGGAASSTGLWVPIGNLVIGTTTKTANIKILGSGNGIIFSDGSKVTGGPPNCTYLGWDNTTKKFICND